MTAENVRQAISELKDLENKFEMVAQDARSRNAVVFKDPFIDNDSMRHEYEDHAQQVGQVIDILGEDSDSEAARKALEDLKKKFDESASRYHSSSQLVFRSWSGNEEKQAEERAKDHARKVADILNLLSKRAIP